ncbi:DUF5076 domain-containing protein [Novosphingobium sp. ERW19]|uniref:DUF5076 domain-containing protein n=1 Tax=Novosphingobium sp. ERW19 TaxID=2726186 RepID=UPI001456F51B|nr:DUF5076 domain-containing protein [Novosphingobium sp. ERW19]
MPNYLIEPAAVRDDSEALEVASVWIAKQGLHCALNVGIYADHDQVDGREAWGVIMADMIGHLSNALQDSYGYDTAQSKAAIVNSLLREVDVPTSELHGFFAD